MGVGNVTMRLDNLLVGLFSLIIGIISLTFDKKINLILGVLCISFGACNLFRE
jgi:hypothetical protein